MKSVEIYTTPWCPYCLRAKSLLKRKNITFKEIDVSDDHRLREAMSKRAGGSTSVPQIFIGTAHIGGCDDLHALENKRQLDALLVA